MSALPHIGHDEQQSSTLPDSLERLEIVPSFSTNSRKNSSSNQFNPFSVIRKCDSIVNMQQELLFGPQCSGCMREATKRRDNGNNFIHTIQSRNKFKANNRSKLLKEPKLKAVSSCIHRSQFARPQDLLDATEGLVDVQSPVISTSYVPDSVSENTDEQLDFRIAMDQCANRLNAACTVGESVAAKPKRNKSRKICKNNAAEVSGASSSRSYSTTENLLDTNPANTPNSQASSTSTCSQQARMNVSTPSCDVTIDELASYFETFVHIPKKMSTMAEMMYI